MLRDSNARGATAVAAYSTRARLGAAVSTPLDWSELSEAIRADHYRVSNIDRRLGNLRRDPWEGFFEVRQIAGSGQGSRKRTVSRSKAASAIPQAERPTR